MSFVEGYFLNLLNVLDYSVEGSLQFVPIRDFTTKNLIQFILIKFKDVFD